jgi:hypothetical protein
MMAMMMAAVRSSETSVNFYQTTQRNVPKTPTFISDFSSRNQDTANHSDGPNYRRMEVGSKLFSPCKNCIKQKVNRWPTKEHFRYPVSIDIASRAEPSNRGIWFGVCQERGAGRSSSSKAGVQSAARGPHATDSPMCFVRPAWMFYNNAPGIWSKIIIWYIKHQFKAEW